MEQVGLGNYFQLKKFVFVQKQKIKQIQKLEK